MPVLSAGVSGSAADQSSTVPVHGASAGASGGWRLPVGAIAVIAVVRCTPYHP